MKIIFIDTETTGLSSELNDVVQIAGYVTENRNIYEQFNLKCQPLNWNSINKQAIDITHPHQTFNQVMDEFRTYDHPKETLVKLKSIFDKYYDETSPDKFIFAGQNTKFDWRFMNAFWGKNKDSDHDTMIKYFNDTIMYDLMDLTKPMKNNGMLNVPNIKLGTIIEALNIQVNGDLHDALTDIEGTYKSFYAMVDDWTTRLRNNPMLERILSESIKHYFKQAAVIGCVYDQK